jgi:hypothetical protein
MNEIFSEQIGWEGDDELCLNKWNGERISYLSISQIRKCEEMMRDWEDGLSLNRWNEKENQSSPNGSGGGLGRGGQIIDLSIERWNEREREQVMEIGEMLDPEKSSGRSNRFLQSNESKNRS